AHARIESLFRRLSEEGISRSHGVPLEFTELAERELIRKIAAFPEEIREAAKAFDPSRITRYVTETAQHFHRFYDTCRVKGEREEVLQSRLALAKAAGIVFKNALTLMKITAPDRM
ncbi:MAG: arginine--tRNA ligase, partial [Oscillospiraceae bacterium]|nr:arginine--tRNA ligase [Oscillospiraceae bacterium]